MKFLAVLALAGAVIAYTPCTGLSENAVCCSVDVLGLLDLDCKHLDEYPEDAEEFQATCASNGGQARCCAIPIAGQGLVCNKPSGVH